MEIFRFKKDLPFMRYAKTLNAVSLITFLVALFFLLTQGLHLSVEFTGGTLIEMSYAKSADLDQMRRILREMGHVDALVQHFGSARDVLVRLPADFSDAQQAISGKEAKRKSSQPSSSDGGKASVSNRHPAAGSADALKRHLLYALEEEGVQAEVRRLEFVGPQVGRALFLDGALALLFVIVGVVFYLAIRFEWKLALAAILANLHDVVIIMGFFSAFQWEFSLPVLAAILAVLGYSVNESVIVFDRIRECFRNDHTGLSVEKVINRAITSTMSRTIITHCSTQLMVLSMLIFGGAALFYFSLALTIGILFGIYSSVFVASGLVMWFGLKREDLVRNLKKTSLGLR